MQLLFCKIIEFFWLSVFDNKEIFTVWVVSFLFNVKNKLKTMSTKEECVLGHIFDEIFRISCWLVRWDNYRLLFKKVICASSILFVLLCVFRTVATLFQSFPKLCILLFRLSNVFVNKIMLFIEDIIRL
jgi:hypothetical protein